MLQLPLGVNVSPTMRRPAGKFRLGSQGQNLVEITLEVGCAPTAAGNLGWSDQIRFGLQTRWGRLAVQSPLPPSAWMENFAPAGI